MYGCLVADWQTGWLGCWLSHCLLNPRHRNTQQRLVSVRVNLPTIHLHVILLATRGITGRRLAALVASFPLSPFSVFLSLLHFLSTFIYFYFFITNKSLLPTLFVYIFLCLPPSHHKLSYSPHPHPYPHLHPVSLLLLLLLLLSYSSFLLPLLWSITFTACHEMIHLTLSTTWAASPG